MQRTDWAEQFAAKFASKPLAHECVFLSPKYLDGTEKEVCDLLFVLRKQAIFVQMKTQEDPLSRSGSKLESWIMKQAGRALDQLGGTIRTLKERSFWCIHPRRGRVEFSPGELALVHGVILVENIDQRLILTARIPTGMQRLADFVFLY